MQEIKNSTAYKIAMKEKVLDMAIFMFTNQGIKAVKMDDIACALQISKRTLYELYANKEDLLLEGLKKHMKLRAEELREMAMKQCNVMDIILNVFCRKVEEYQKTNPLFYDDIVRYPKVLEHFEKERLKNQSQMENFMTRGMDEGYFRKDVNYNLISIMFDKLHKIIMTNRLYVTYSMEEILKGIIFVFLRGVCTEKGIKVMDEFLTKD